MAQSYPQLYFENMMPTKDGIRQIGENFLIEIESEYGNSSFNILPKE